jgi:hypothetical protein
MQQARQQALVEDQHHHHHHVHGSMPFVFFNQIERVAVAAQEVK